MTWKVEARKISIHCSYEMDYNFKRSRNQYIVQNQIVRPQSTTKIKSTDKSLYIAGEKPHNFIL